MSKTPHIVIASPVRQSPKILRYFLDSLANLDTDSFFIEYLFADDNDVEESRKLLREFIAKYPAARWVQVDQRRESYVKNDVTHHWTARLMEHVGTVKDEIIRYALDCGATHLFLVDSDLVLHPLTLQQLIALDLPIVSEVFWTKWQPNTQELPQVWLGGQYRLYQQSPGEKLSAEVQAVRTQDVLAKLRKPGVYEVGGLGALTLFRRDALARGVRFAPIKNLDLIGEDRHLCVRAAALGIPLHVDTHYPALHLYRTEDLVKVPEYVSRTRQEYQISRALRFFFEDLYRTSITTEPAPIRFATGALQEAVQERRERSSDTVRTDVVIERPEIHSVIVDNVERGSSRVKFTLINSGCENGEAFRDFFTGEASVVLEEGEWLVSEFELIPTPPSRPTSLEELASGN